MQFLILFVSSGVFMIFQLTSLPDILTALQNQCNEVNFQILFHTFKEIHFKWKKIFYINFRSAKVQMKCFSYPQRDWFKAVQYYNQTLDKDVPYLL